MSHELVLRSGEQELRVSPRGGRIVDYAVRGSRVIAGVQSPTGPFAYRSALLAPWPNRITAGRWAWRGTQYQLDVNQPETNSALHGLVVGANFTVAHSSPVSCTLLHELQPHPGYPFRLEISASYTLGVNGLTCSLAAANLENEPVPVGLGVHPYFDAADLVDEVVLNLPANRILVTDDEWREVDRKIVDGTDDDYRSGRSLAGRDVDAAFTDLDRRPDGCTEASLHRGDGLRVRVWGGDTCRWFVVYTGHTLGADERRRTMCVEPMTCGPNAFVTGEVDVLAPGETLALDWGVTSSAGSG